MKIAEPVEFRFSFRSLPADVFANARLTIRGHVGRPCSFSKSKQTINIKLDSTKRTKKKRRKR